VGDQAGQVIARQWLISEADGRTQEVRGLAVVGHQPLLQPGEQFEYSSWVQVETPVASMRGTYFCMSDDAHPFEADIPAFDLVYPGMLH
jgi:ApaG protein